MNLAPRTNLHANLAIKASSVLTRWPMNMRLALTLASMMFQMDTTQIWKQAELKRQQSAQLATGAKKPPKTTQPTFPSLVRRVNTRMKVLLRAQIA